MTDFPGEWSVEREARAASAAPTSLERPQSPEIAALTDEQIAAMFAVALAVRHLRPEELTAAQRAVVVLARRIARVRFRWFIEYVTADDLAPYSFDAFHEALIAELQMSFEGAAPRLLISAPPRHGKSRLCAILYPCFVAGNDPRSFVIIASYSQELAREHLREARSVLLCPAFGEIFPACELDPEAMAMDLIRTRAGGYLRGVGVGGTLTGLSATHLILDDLVKSYDEAASDLIRTSTSQWYRTAARTRLSPDGKIVAIGTRWHHQDILGEIVAASDNGSGEHWEHRTFPAIDAEGNALWPQRYPVPALNDLRATLGTMQFQALFQGSPTPAGGGFFREEWFPFYVPGKDLAPERDLLTLICTDFATSEGAGDYSVIAVVSVDPSAQIFVRHLWRERVTMDKVLTELVAICKRWGPSIWCYENDSIMLSSLPLLRARLMQYKINLWHLINSRQASKIQKAMALQGLAEAQGIFVPADAPWVGELIAEALTFPVGQHSPDQIDALGQLGRSWPKLRPKAITTEIPKPTGMCLEELWPTVRSRNGERV